MVGNVEILLIAFFFSMWHGFGITIGLHRLLSHRTFRCSKLVEYCFVIPAYLAFQGSPLWWVTIHRAHHRWVDTPLDPHAPNMGLFHSYAFYRKFKYPDHIDPNNLCPDLAKDPLYKFLECGGDWRLGYIMCFVFSSLFRAMLLYLFGWEVFWGSVIATVLAWNLPLLLNVICHIPRLGYRNYATGDDSVNVSWFAILTFGEGWHNNHHAFPGSSKMGILWYEFDVAWLLIKSMQKLSLVHSVNESYVKPEQYGQPQTIEPKEQKLSS